ncbi:TetR/AcrR family transcriptional regulator C-terminal domain-containing protein [Flavobacteriaceae bacterium F89]|uniref:Biofilm operon icaADBC HTH-type negative transcriptional regulator IcaR n=1 Tax=Cerina litoralis TaxID=2874477 RepID=A0AAE3EXG1_9FLAO|nr:TetR/AcrR family transcriptional regulator C-terminal domain-containing protein [Cerina litoralis]MCG2461482.1 TetR/AcrR family transcriptional regulator C-terminal domain-containing protein [Cerina litoralis]
MGRKSLKGIRQKEIVEAFYKVARREGLEHASLAKVAGEMGINPSLVSHYFGSKNALIFGLIEFILASYKNFYTLDYGEPEYGSRLRNIIENLFSREWDKLIDDEVFYDCFTLVFRNENIKTAYKELHEHLRKWLTEAIEEAKRKGEVHVDDPESAADLIFILVEGSYYYLSMFDIGDEYFEKQNRYKHAALDILKFNITDTI